MKIELIPVLKIGYGNQGVTASDNSSFCKLSDITDSNLTKLTIDHTQEMRDGKYKRPQDTCAFPGGYVLRVDGQDKYFSQCCGELSDIIYWDRISNGQSSYSEGHPAPQIKFEDNTIVFDFSVDEYDEPFQPKPTENILSVDRLELKKAVEKVKIELKTFEQRLDKINEDEKLNIDNIGGLLIWDNGNYD